MIGRKRSAKRGHNVVDSSAEYGNRIHIPFYNNGISLFLNSPMRAVQTEENPALIK